MKKVITHLKEYWVKYLIESFVVMFSILGAFALSSWNESRKERQQDIEFLKNLKIELNVDISSLREKQEEYEEINKEIITTIGLMDSSYKDLTDDESVIVSRALTSLQVLTPMQKNASRNDRMIAE